MDHGPTARWTGIFARWHAADEARRRLLLQRREQADVLARMLVARFGAERVVLFGSIARGESQGRLDIDLAVAGVSRDRELGAIALLGDEAGCSVDLVRLEDANPRLAAAIERDGIVLYERG